jgi:DNA-3-methyladenine glycosylase II
MAKKLRRSSEIERRLARSDPALGRVIDAVVLRIGPQRIAPSGVTPFEALVRAVVYQSVSETAAGSIFSRLKETVKAPLTPKRIIALRDRSMTAAGLSKAKSRTIKALARWFVGQRELAAALPGLPDVEVVELLTNIPGIGAWTVNVFLIFNLGRADVMPAADLGIRRGVRLVRDLRAIATPKQVMESAEKWRPYRSIASIYLWQAMKLKLGPSELNEGKKR